MHAELKKGAIPIPDSPHISLLLYVQGPVGAIRHLQCVIQWCKWMKKLNRCYKWLVRAQAPGRPLKGILWSQLLDNLPEMSEWRELAGVSQCSWPHTCWNASCVGNGLCRLPYWGCSSLSLGVGVYESHLNASESHPAHPPTQLPQPREDKTVELLTAGHSKVTGRESKTVFSPLWTFSNCWSGLFFWIIQRRQQVLCQLREDLLPVSHSLIKQRSAISEQIRF